MRAEIEAGKTGQFDVVADGETVAARKANWFTRRLGAGYPEFDQVLEALGSRRKR